MRKPKHHWLRSTRLAAILTLAGAWLGASPAVAAPDAITRAVGAYEQGNYDLAIGYFTQLIDSGSRDAYLGRAKAFFQKQDYDRAIADLNIVIRDDPGAAAFELRGQAWFKKANYQTAAGDFSFAIHLRPNDPDLILQRADAWFYAGEPRRAFQDYNRFIQLNSTNATAYAHRGMLNAAYKHDYRRGIVDCLTAISLDPKCWLGYNNLAALLTICPSAKIRDGQLAVLHAQRACELTYWKNPLPLSVLAAAYAECGDFADAIKWQQQSMYLNLDSGPEGARLALAGEKKLALYQNHKPFRAQRY
jgi:tetratricopeptide (TPR) repeat protein